MAPRTGAADFLLWAGSVAGRRRRRRPVWLPRTLLRLRGLASARARRWRRHGRVASAAGARRGASSERQPPTCAASAGPARRGRGGGAAHGAAVFSAGLASWPAGGRGVVEGCAHLGGGLRGEPSRGLALRPWRLVGGLARRRAWRRVGRRRVSLTGASPSAPSRPSTPSALSAVVGSSITWTDPPAASILATALRLNASATTNSAADDLAVAEDLERLVQRAHEPDRAQDLLVDRDRGGLAGFAASLSLAAAFGPGISPGSSAPSSTSSAIRPRFTTSYWILNGFLKPRSFGMRMWIGVWPPSNQGGIVPPARAFWPFVPRPAVLPLPAGDAPADAGLGACARRPRAAGRAASCLLLGRLGNPGPPRPRPGSGPGGPCRGSRRWPGPRPSGRCDAGRGRGRSPGCARCG